MVDTDGVVLAVATGDPGFAISADCRDYTGMSVRGSSEPCRVPAQIEDEAKWKDRFYTIVYSHTPISTDTAARSVVIYGDDEFRNKIYRLADIEKSDRHTLEVPQGNYITFNGSFTDDFSGYRKSVYILAHLKNRVSFFTIIVKTWINATFPN